jgi:putative ABC transport system substrate-binding protein
MKKAAVPSILVAVVLLVLGITAEAQQPNKVPRTGYLTVGDAATESARAEAIRLALRELGYIQGQNIAFEYRYGENKRDRYAELAAELVRLKVDVIVVTGGDPYIQVVKNATKSTPIVMVGSGSDPVKAGFVESLARPGGNITGLTALSRELGGKRLELLKEAVSKVARVAVLYDATSPAPTREVKEDLPVAARALGLTIQPWEVRGGDDFDKVFSGMGKQRPDGLFVLGGGPLMATNRNRIVSIKMCDFWIFVPQSPAD